MLRLRLLKPSARLSPFSLPDFYFIRKRLQHGKCLAVLSVLPAWYLSTSPETGWTCILPLNGDGAILLSTVAYAFSSVFMKRFSVQDNPVMLSGYQFILGGIVMAVCGFFMGGHLSGFTLPAFAMLFYLGVISQWPTLYGVCC